MFVFRFVAESSVICCFYVQLQPPAPRLWLPQRRWGRCRRQFLLFCHLPLTSTSSATVVAPLVPGGSEAAIAWATMINAISGYSSTPLKLNVQCVFIANGLPTVPKSLLERIQKWEYVDLAHLLPTQSLHDQVSETRAMFTLFPGCELVRPKKRQIQSIMEWVKTFTVFTAAVALKDPAQVVEFLAYQLTKAAQSYNGLQWRAYETQCPMPLGTRHGRSSISTFTRVTLPDERGRCSAALCVTAPRTPPRISRQGVRTAASRQHYSPRSGNIHGTLTFANCLIPLSARSARNTSISTHVESAVAPTTRGPGHLPPSQQRQHQQQYGSHLQRWAAAAAVVERQQCQLSSGSSLVGLRNGWVAAAAAFAVEQQQQQHGLNLQGWAAAAAVVERQQRQLSSGSNIGRRMAGRRRVAATEVGGWKHAAFPGLVGTAVGGGVWPVASSDFS